MLRNRYTNYMRRATPQLLIAILLICPYFCLGEIAGGMNALHDSDSCSCSGHSCFGHSSQSDGEAPNESQSDCLCHGAGAVADGLRTAQAESLLSLTIGSWLPDAVSLTSDVPSLTAISFEPPHQFPPFSTGRDVCALVGILLL